MGSMVQLHRSGTDVATYFRLHNEEMYVIHELRIRGSYGLPCLQRPRCEHGPLPSLGAVEAHSVGEESSANRATPLWIWRCRINHVSARDTSEESAKVSFARNSVRGTSTCQRYQAVACESGQPYLYMWGNVNTCLGRGRERVEFIKNDATAARSAPRSVMLWYVGECRDARNHNADALGSTIIRR
jgi:hypothetical protein